MIRAVSDMLKTVFRGARSSTFPVPITALQLYSRLNIRRGRTRLYQIAARLAQSKTPLEMETSWRGKFLVYLDDDVYQDLVLDGEIEPLTTHVARQLASRGGVAVDIGANFGWFAVLFANLVGSSGRVVAFEPVPRSFRRLRQNLELNAAHNVSAHEVALSRELGTAQLHVFRGIGSGHSSFADIGRADSERIEVITAPLDEILRQQGITHVDLVKIDVEGAEPAVLAGARATIERDDAPALIIEVSSEMSHAAGHSPSELLASIPARYHLYAIYERERTIVRLTAHRTPAHDCNVVCVAREDHRSTMERLARGVF